MSKSRRWGRRTRRVDIAVHPRSGERLGDLNSAQLQHRLVTDAIQGFPEGETESTSALYLMWSVEAYKRIAELDGIGFDDAFLRVRQEIASLGGVLPTAPGS